MSAFITTPLSWVTVTTLLSAECSCRRPSSASLVNPQSTMSSIISGWQHQHLSDDSIHRLCKFAAHWPCPGVVSVEHGPLNWWERSFLVVIIINCNNNNIQVLSHSEDMNNLKRARPSWWIPIIMRLILLMCQSIQHRHEQTHSLLAHAERNGLKMMARWCQDTSDPGHFGPKTFRH